MIALLIIVLIVTGFMLIPIGADIGYEGGELKVSAKVCGLALQILPKKQEGEAKPKKEKKPKRIKKKRPKPPGEEAKKKKKALSLNRDEILQLVKTVLSRFGKFGRKFQVDRFLLRYTAAGTDPCDTATAFAYVNAALSSLAPVCRKRFQVKDCQVSTDIDFLAEKTRIDFGLALSIRIGQILGSLFSILFGALWILIKNKVRLLLEKRKNRNNSSNGENGPDAGVQIETKEKEKNQAEERMEANG